MKTKLTAEEKTARSEARKAERKAAKETARIEAEKNQKPVKSITIKIEWIKSRTWGMNPRAEAVVTFQDGTGERRGGYTCSGCGYDKESTVISQIFNDFLKYKLYQGLTGEPPYGMYNRNDWKGYDGGVGTSCYYNISEYIGGRFENVASGKTFDVYKYTEE